MSNKQENAYRESFKLWKIAANDPSIVLMEEMSYNLNLFKIPKVFRNVVNKCFTDNLLEYSEPGGMSELKDEIMDYEFEVNSSLKKRNAFVFVGSGISEVFYRYMKAILSLPENRNRKKVILFKPGYLFFDISVNRAGGKVKHVEGFRKDKFIPKIDLVKKAMTSDVCAIVIVNPHNPTGIEYDNKYLSEIVLSALKKKIFVISDEVYESMLKPGKTHTNIFSIRNSFNYTVRMFGPVKDRPGFSGVRIGYGIGDKRLESLLMNDYLGQSFSGNIISEYLFLYDMTLRKYILNEKKYKGKILDISQDEVEDYKRVVEHNKRIIFKLQDFVLCKLSKRKDVFDFIEPDGCNMVFFAKKNLKNKKFVDFGVGLYSGDFFNCSGKDDKCWSRICLTTNADYLKRGIDRLSH